MTIELCKIARIFDDLTCTEGEGIKNHSIPRGRGIGSTTVRNLNPLASISRDMSQ